MRVLAWTVVLLGAGFGMGGCTKTEAERGEAPAALEKPSPQLATSEPKETATAEAPAEKKAEVPPAKKAAPRGIAGTPAPGSGSGMMGMGGGMFGIGGGLGGLGGLGGGLGGLGGMMGAGPPPPPPGAGGPAGPLAGSIDAKAHAATAKPLDAAAAPGLAAGQLTAGSFDDNLDLAAFHRFLGKLDKEEAAIRDVAARLNGRRVTITVTDRSGQPVDNAYVSVRAGKASIELRSRTDGRAIVVAPWDGLPPSAEWTVTVTPPDGGPALSRTCAPGADRLDIALTERPSPVTRVLDLALVVDTTGSMGDELRYLQAELKWIATTLKTRYPEVVQRYALIVYRDEGDEYVTRTFPFTEALDRLLADIHAQSAGGGGDYPEAVHKAMEAAEKLDWSSVRAARLLVHVADAPPHTPDLERSLKAVDRLRKAGVTFYPVACSGYDRTCELHMRASALLTGGQFLFLTDDSGIGNAHAEPRVPGYHVERLNRLLVRVIASEIAGRRIEPRPEEILRTSGTPPKLGGR